MTAPVSKSATSGKIALDAPIFDPVAFRLSSEQADIISRARELGQTIFAGRAAAYDRDAKFPIQNYRDLHRTGLLGIAIPKKHGGLGADSQTYALAAAEIGRYCGATALTWNMHVCSTLWSGPLADDLDMDGATRAAQEPRRPAQSMSAAARCTTSVSSRTARSIRTRSRKAAQLLPAASRSAPKRNPPRA